MAAEEMTAMDIDVQAPTWPQDHERRITENSKDIEKLCSDIELLRGENSEIKLDIRELKDIIHKGNNNQLEILNDMNKQMRDEFFKKKSTTHTEKWKLAGVIAGGIVGGGGLLVGLGTIAYQLITGG